METEKSFNHYLNDFEKRLSLYRHFPKNNFSIILKGSEYKFEDRVDNIKNAQTILDLLFRRPLIRLTAKLHSYGFGIDNYVKLKYGIKLASILETQDDDTLRQVLTEMDVPIDSNFNKFTIDNCPANEYFKDHTIFSKKRRELIMDDEDTKQCIKLRHMILLAVTKYLTVDFKPNHDAWLDLDTKKLTLLVGDIDKSITSSNYECIVSVNDRSSCYQEGCIYVDIDQDKSQLILEGAGIFGLEKIYQMHDLESEMKVIYGKGTIYPNDECSSYHCLTDFILSDNIKQQKEGENNMDYEKFIANCKELIIKYYEKEYHRVISSTDVYVVWMVKVLQNNKALLSTNIPDTMYYEITYDGEKKRVYFDAYVKKTNKAEKIDDNGFVEYDAPMTREI